MRGNGRQGYRDVSDIAFSLNALAARRRTADRIELGRRQYRALYRPSIAAEAAEFREREVLGAPVVLTDEDDCRRVVPAPRGITR